MRRLTLSLRRGPALRVTRASIGNNKLVYVIVTDKNLRYPDGKSRIAYIGTTRKGVGRIARSAAYRAPTILAIHGVREFQVRVVTCRPRQHVKTWAKNNRLYWREVEVAIQSGKPVPQEVRAEYKQLKGMK